MLKGGTQRIFLCQFVEHKKLLVWKRFYSNLIRLVSFEEVFATLGIEFCRYMCMKKAENLELMFSLKFQMIAIQNLFKLQSHTIYIYFMNK